MTTHITLSVPDISCAHCVATVEKCVKALPGVQSVSASEQSKLVEIEFDATKVDQAQIATVLDEAGYPEA